MSSGGSQAPVQQVQTSTPWSGAQPYLSQLYTTASNNLIGPDIGYQPYPNQTYADQNPYFSLGWNSAYGLANADRGGAPGTNAALSLAQQMQEQQGLSSGQTGYVIPQMQQAAGQFGGIYGRAGDVYNEASGQQNPYLLSQLEAQNRRIADKVNSSMSGAGRYGSGAHTDVLGRSLAEASYPVLAQDYAQRQQQRLAALQGQQAATAGGLGALGGISDIYSGGLQRAGQFGQAIPGLEQARYAGANELMGLGQYQMDQSQKAINDQINYWNAIEARPWEQEQRYASILSGAGGLGGTRVTTSPSTAPPIGTSILGGALAGGGLGSMFGPFGSGIGALGGGLLGALR